ncbi:MAG TPA: YraN family protein [Oligoflexus sp.]|uniref:YraN family protein n=1 Tax=Oligoflexus sp. TaxID=1971216 RepID=UPI002D7F2A09|nr:YraN family protein [Oligoflexus sp.]HET9238745.1 YraN family protein [Oligoflexus sp.]
MRSLVITLPLRYKRARRGEALVAAWLSHRGFHVIAQNFRRKSLELDLVAVKGRELLIIEVKTRSAPIDDWQHLIPPRKLAAIWRGSDRFLNEHPEYMDYTIHLGLALVTEKCGVPVAWMRLPAASDST